MTTNGKPKRIVKRCGNCGWFEVGRNSGQGSNCLCPVPASIWTHKFAVFKYDGKDCQCWKERAK